MSARLTWRMTREYVQNVLAESGAPIEVRVSVSQVKTWLKTIEARLSTAGFQKKLASAALQMEQKERQLLRRQVESVQRELEELASKLAPKKGG